MKNLFRILATVAIILVIFIYFDNPVKENETLTGKNNSEQVITQHTSEMEESNNIFTRPKTGVSTLIGKSTSEVTKTLGKPTRIEPTVFGYEWWVYNNSFSTYQLIGVTDETVTQAFIIGEEIDVTPYKMGQSLEDIYRFTLVQSEITISIDKSTYTFTLGENDFNNRILVQFDGLFAMLYIDEQDGKLDGIRFLDAKTLLVHKPYDISYDGEMIDTITPTSTLQASVDRAIERQIVEITNVLRVKHNLAVLETDVILQQIARTHSEEMANNNVLNESLEASKFSDKLDEYSIVYDSAGGNTAAFYIDAGEAVAGWINSKDHRNTLFGKNYTHIGVGVYGNYFTQNFIQKPNRNEQTE